MKIFKNVLLIGFMFLSTLTAFSQSKVTGTVIDGDLNQPLAGANVVVKGTSTGTVTDFDGKFEISTTEKSGQIVISYLGFVTKTISFTVTGNSVNVGNIVVDPDASQLEEVVVIGKGIIDVAKERKTPIAVSTIKAVEIQEKVGTSDVTQAMVNTPSVYVAGQSGGYGDSRITVRGFQQDNTAFLLNGQPINGMEDGKMYWSNWSGMSDIANFIQIQRGLGSSKLAISSVGGTVNFVTKATDKKEGGFVSMGVANSDYFKSTAAYNTGIMKNGFGASVMLSHWQGDGYNQGTRGEGQNYFISFGYKPNDKHNFNFLITGAPQQHDQNFTKRISDYLGFGRKYNNNFGYLNGQYLSERTNFYHKPVANLNWDFKINESTELSTVLYASWGRGGGTGNYGSGKRSISQFNPYTGANQNTYIDYDQIYANNLADADGIGTSSNYLIRASMNNHAWYGLVTNFKKELNENLNLNFGLDLRTYNGDHYRQVANFVGLNGWTESRRLRDNTHFSSNSLPLATNTVNQSYNINPWYAFFNTADDAQKIDYDYSETISYGGVFGQLEYSKENFSTFFQGAISNQTHQRFDYYDYQNQYQDSDKVSNVGYNVKAGGAYNFAEKHAVYANAGYYSRQPYHDNIYLNFTNQVNPLTENEKVLGLEAGYTFKSKIFSGSLNAYRTTWEDRVVTTSTVQAADGVIGSTPVLAGDVIFTSNQGVKQVHSGIELDFVLKPMNKLDIKGFASFGNWEYDGKAISRKFDENLNLLVETETDLKGGKVGDAAQTTWGLGAKYEIFERFTIDADWRNYDNLYANVVAKDNLELPSYDLVDAGISYKMLVGKNKQNSVNFRFNMNNVFNEIYLSELTSNIKTTDNISSSNPALGTYQSNNRVYNGIADGNFGFFGLGRTWNFTMRYNF
ncbi:MULTISPECIES: TonB-dependent receptor domain-containing protein [unclassified Flavobacterium]|uniref:TonB-dependent receptor n=1 Tax=unclassified Flavobacterium TaxID=196869 RepID=UPI00129212C4|nr:MULTISPECIES: TonB-dependent receptor [unclassified Flavobacterium]MQP51666.1 TonB-dependent receptor [Flavobacterium sp. LMO9]MQP61106.1 TonB-dependent receptor [Flavobacterium sp. LMO6]